MATLSLRMRDDLKTKAQELASQQWVLLNSYMNATLAATISQRETLAMRGDRLSDFDQEKWLARVLKFMLRTRSGTEPKISPMELAIGKKHKSQDHEDLSRVN